MSRSYWNAEVLAWVDRFKSEKWRPAVLACSGLWSVFKLFQWKNHTSGLTLRWIVPWHHRGFIFEHPPPVPLCAPTMQTTGKRQFSLICGSSEPGSGPWNEFISPQCDANEWFYSNITPCHNQLCILKREEMRRSVYRSTRQWLAIQTDGKDPRRKKKKTSYPVLLRWLYKEFHFAVTSFSIMATFGLFHSLTLFSHFYCIEFLISKHRYL